MHENNNNIFINTKQPQRQNKRNMERFFDDDENQFQLIIGFAFFRYFCLYFKYDTTTFIQGKKMPMEEANVENERHDKH